MQGAYEEHINILQDLDVSPVEIRNKNDLQNIDGIIIPGGESTTMGKLIRTLDIYNDLKEKIESGMPVWGTCAGMILLAKSICNDDTVHFRTCRIHTWFNRFYST